MAIDIASLYPDSAVNLIKNAADSSGSSSSSTNKSESFDEIYNAAVNLIQGTNAYIQQAQQAEIDFAMGELTNTHELAIIESKANIALQYTVAIKNGILDAYKEIMQIQI